MKCGELSIIKDYYIQAIVSNGDQLGYCANLPVSLMILHEI